MAVFGRRHLAFHRPCGNVSGLASRPVVKRRLKDQGPGVVPPEPEVRELVARISELGGSTETRAFRITLGTEWIMRRAMANEALRTQLFRFVDALPAMADDADLYRHVEEYFGTDILPGPLERVLAASARVPGGRKLVARLARREVARMATQFIVATDARTTAAKLEELWRRGRAATVDLLGEHTHSHAEADRYAARLGELVSVLIEASRAWPRDEVLERDDLGQLGRVAVAIKPTALAPDFASLTADAGIKSASQRLMGILESAADNGAQVWFDLERYEVKHITHRLVRELLSRPELAGLQAGIVVQTYLRDSYEDLLSLCQWATTREVPLGIRLVKGAYWDTETVVAEAAGWPVPVYEQKGETDANFERCVRLVHSYHGQVRAAFGSHNLRSLAYAIAAAAPRASLTTATRSSCSGGWQSPCTRHSAARLPFEGVLTHGRARARHGVSRAALAREHLQRQLREVALCRAQGARNSRVSSRRRPRRGLFGQPRLGRREAKRHRCPPAVALFARASRALVRPGVHRADGHRPRERPCRSRCRGGRADRRFGDPHPRTIASVDPADPARIVAVSACCGVSDGGPCS